MKQSTTYYHFISLLFLINSCNNNTNRDINKANQPTNNFDSLINLVPKKSDSISFALLKQSIEFGNELEITDAYIARINALIGLGKFDDANVTAEKCLIVATNSKQTIKILNVQYLIAITQLQQGKFGLSAKTFSSLLPKLEKHKQYYLLTKAKSNLGWSYYNSNQYELAILQIKEALNDAKKYQFKDLLFDYNQRLGSVFAQFHTVVKNKNYIDSAFKYFIICEQLLQSKNSQPELAFFYENIGNLHQINNTYDSAIVYYLKSSKILESLNLKLEQGYLYSNIGLVFQRMNRFDKSLEFYIKSKIIADTFKNIDLNTSIAKNIAVLYEKTGDYKKSSNYYNEYIELYTQKVNEEVQKSNAEINANYQTEKKEKENAELKLNQLKLEKRNLSIIWTSIAALGVVSGFIIIIYKRRKRVEKNKIDAELSQQRKRFSRDLHDNIGSRTSLLLKNLETIKNTENRIEIDKLTSNATDILQNLRETVWAMNEGNLSIESLADKITQFAQNRLPIETNIKLEIAQDIHEDKQLSAEDFLNIYRICQEAINNAIKYSQATLLNLNLEFTQENWLKIEIKDNGKGFVSSNIETSHFGIQNMKNRAAESKINLEIEIKKGTQIKLWKQY